MVIRDILGHNFLQIPVSVGMIVDTNNTGKKWYTAHCTSSGEGTKNNFGGGWVRREDPLFHFQGPIFYWWVDGADKKETWCIFLHLLPTYFSGKQFLVSEQT